MVHITKVGEASGNNQTCMQMYLNFTSEQILMCLYSLLNNVCLLELKFFNYLLDQVMKGLLQIHGHIHQNTVKVKTF